MQNNQDWFCCDCSDCEGWLQHMEQHDHHEVDLATETRSTIAQQKKQEKKGRVHDEVSISFNVMILDIQ